MPRHHCCFTISTGEQLLIGTSKGQLLVYDVPHQRGGGGRFNVKLRLTKKDFLNRRARQAPVQQLTVVEEFRYAYWRTIPSRAVWQRGVASGHAASVSRRE